MGRSRITRSSQRRFTVACCKALGAYGAKEALDQMIVCDDVIANHDRHFRNFGVVRNVETLECRLPHIHSALEWRIDRITDIAEWS